MWDRFLFLLLTLLAVSTSGVLTYFGAINLYQGIPFLHYVLMGLIAVYICAVSYFWYQLYSFVSIPHRSFFHRVKLLMVSSVVLVIIWFTSTYFNIISLSGMSVTNKQIQAKLDSLDFELITSLEDERRLMEEISGHLLALAAAAEIGADNELEIDGRDREVSKGPMFTGYRDMGGQLVFLSRSFEDSADIVGEVLSDETREAIDAFRRSVSSVPFFQQRQRLAEQEVRSLNLAYSEYRLQRKASRQNSASEYSRPAVASASGGMAVPADILAIAGAQEQTVSHGEAETGVSSDASVISPPVPTATPAAGGESAESFFLRESREQMALFRGYLAIVMDTMRLASPVIMWEVRDRYQELLAQAVQDWLTNIPGPAANLPAIETLLDMAGYQLTSARKRLSELPGTLRVRTETRFIPFLESIITHLTEIKTRLIQRTKAAGANGGAAHEPTFYRGLRLESIDTAIWKPEYRSLPMIALAVLIDFILIPILMVKGIVTKARAHSEKIGLRQQEQGKGVP